MPVNRRPLVQTRYLLGLVVLVVAGAVALAGNLPRKVAEAAVESSVVKVSVHSNPPDLLSPWQKVGTTSFTGSGVIIDGNRILTSARVVEDAVNIEVRRAGMTEQYVAEVSFIGPECDLDC